MWCCNEWSHKIKSQSDVQFDVERYLAEIPYGWNIHPKSKPLEVRNN